ncbi:MAG: signal peptidase I [Opitutales bacterium]|nr:signal peptidase I [Opitutales bacterium]
MTVSNQVRKANRRERKGAKELLRIGLKVWFYRNDRLPPIEERALQIANHGLRDALKAKDISSQELEKKARILDEALRKSGGSYYHKKNWVENVEMFLVAAIVILGIRSFFVQPFIIPTNSMFPSFYGMTPHIYEEEPPNLLERGADKLLLGASHYRMEAESSGTLYLVLQNGSSHRYVQANFPNGRFFIIPTMVREYVFEIGGKEHSIKVPAEFDMDELLSKKFAGIESLRDLPMIIPQDESLSRGRLKLSEKKFSKGDIPLAFDVLLGDALFVDRMSYNFITPKVGDPIVFRTESIDRFNYELGTKSFSQIGEDKYYIKRLVGEPGDQLEMRVPKSIFTNGTDVRKGVPGILYRNDKNIDGSSAFDENRRQTEYFAESAGDQLLADYPGYRAEGLLANRSILKVPHNNDPDNPTGINGYLAMGDNSTDSLDGRAWGFVPEHELVGRALFVYYPFTKRWGPSK